MTVLWLPGRPLHSSDEAGALDDLNPPPPLPADPWKGPDMSRTDARPGRVRLDEVVHLLRYGDTIETVARTLGVREDSIIRAACKRGTPEQKSRIAQASEAMRDIRIGLAS